MAHIPSFLLLAAVASALFACHGSVGAAPNGTNVPVPSARMTPTPQAASLTPGRNQTFSVVLDGLGATGYAWHLQEGFDTRVLASAGQRYGELPNQPLAGQSAPEIFDFKTAGAGTTTLTFVAYREWEGPAKDNEARRFTVTVR